MNNQDFLVSIIMPAYNAEKHIKEAISSVLKQEYTALELIVINDGSNDKTKAIINSFNDERIKYFEQKNQGVSVARNLGLSNMKGELFCFLDADDILPSKSILCRVELFSNPEIYFVDGKVELFNEKNNSIIRTYLPKIKNCNPMNGLLALDGSCFMGLSWMIRNTQKINPFRTDMTHSEDLVFYIDNAEKGLFTFTEEIVLRYRRSENSAMSNLDGLYKGYLKTLEIITSKNIELKLVIAFKRKMKSIMIKSYLKKFNIFKTLKVIFN
jgi:teichuronic acid biosynthesis glycosyltransferase TuaG